MLSHTPALLQQLFMYRVASSATISSELLHACFIDLSHGRIPELHVQMTSPFRQRVKIFLAHPYNYEIFFTQFFSYEIFSTRIFSNLRYTLWPLQQYRYMMSHMHINWVKPNLCTGAFNQSGYYTPTRSGVH